MQFGSAYWRFLHYFAIHGVDRTFIKKLIDFIPCDECKLEWVDPTDDEDLVTWSKDLHNKVNAKLGKYDKYDMTDFNICQKGDCDLCTNNEIKHLFPWEFVHFIAYKFDVVALEFLKEFNNKYPCTTCRDNFFTDDPQQGETVLAWTVRHHNRVNASKGMNPYVFGVSNDTPGCEGCATTGLATTTE